MRPARGRSGPDPQRAQYLQADAAAGRGEPVVARAHREQCLALFREVGDVWGALLVGRLVARDLVDRGEYAAARAKVEENQAWARELGDPSSIANALHDLGSIVASTRGDYATARALGLDSLALYRQHADKTGEMAVFILLAEVALGEGDAATAGAMAEAGLAIARVVAEPDFIARALVLLAEVASRRGAVAAARARYAEGLAIYAGPASCHFQWWATRHPLEGLAGLAAPDQPARALRLAAAAATLRDASGVTMLPTERAWLERALAPAHSALSGEAAAAAWAVGRAMTLEQATEDALTELAG